MATDPREHRDRLNHLSHVIIGAALAVHREVGPGMLESAYEACLAFELSHRGLEFEKQKPLPLAYKGIRLGCGFRLDFLVEKLVVVEVKAVERVEKIHRSQLRHYLKQTKLNLGLLINFNVHLLEDGIHRVVNGFPE
jgi:GxxExxY protein